MTQAEAEWLLAECRRKIDAIDVQLRDLLNRRAQLAEEIRRTKDVLGLAVHQPQRESEILEKITAENPGPLGSDAVRAIFRCIIQEIRELEAKGEGTHE
jgi:chorismate mutase/prephenate dehydratase